MLLTLLFSIVLLFWQATTLAFHKIIRNDDFCGKKCWILNMIDHLRCCFNYVRSFAATSEGELSTQMGSSSTASYYAMTMKFGAKNAGAFKTQYAVRSYAKLSNGTYVYSDISTLNVYDVASYLYENKKMNTESAHEYLYNNILTVVNPSYQKVDYPTWSVLVPTNF